MAQIGITLEPTLTIGLTLSSGGSVVTLDGAVPDGLLHTLSLAPAGPVVLATAGEILRGERGLRGEQGLPGVAGAVGAPGALGTNGTNGIDGTDGLDGVLLPEVEAVAQTEAEELRLDIDALVLATLSI